MSEYQDVNWSFVRANGHRHKADEAHADERWDSRDFFIQKAALVVSMAHTEQTARLAEATEVANLIEVFKVDPEAGVFSEGQYQWMSEEIARRLRIRESEKV